MTCACVMTPDGKIGSLCGLHMEALRDHEKWVRASESKKVQDVNNVTIERLGTLVNVLVDQIIELKKKK